MAKFQVVSQFLGYRNKQDETNLPPGHLISGAQNVVSTDGATVAIRQGYTLDGSNLTDDLVGYWSFDENGGTSTADLSGNGNTGTLTNMDDADWVAGKFGNGLDFDGTDDVVVVTDDDNIQNIFDGGGAVSVYVDVDSDGENNDGRIIDKGAWYISVNNESGGTVSLTFHHQFSGTNGQWTTTNRDITLNSFTHVAVVYDNSDVANNPKIYINNQLREVTEDTTPVGTRTTDVGTNLRFGNNSAGDRTFDGIIDDVRLFNATIDLWKINQLSKDPRTRVEGSYEWQAHRGDGLYLKSYDDALFVKYTTGLGGDGEWYMINDGYTAVDFEFAEWWDSATEAQDLLLFVNGDANMRMWSGGVASFSSATWGGASGTITKEGTTTWAEEGFLTGGTRQIIINGVTYTYTGGETTTTITGVTPNPTLVAHAAGDVAIQAPRVTATTPASGFKNDHIAVLDNQVYVGSETSREVYVSANNDYIDYTFASPRTPGQGALLTLDGVCKGFAVDLEAMYISAGDDFWFQTVLTTSDDNTREILTVKRLKTSPQQGALGQSAIGKIKNFIVFVSNEPTLDFLGNVENINVQQSLPISDPIKTEFENLTLTLLPHIKYYKNNIYITVPSDSKMLIFNLDKGYWEAPWVLPAGRLAIIDDELYLHSNTTGQTFKLFQGYNDNGNPIEAKARFSYMNYGDRVNMKNHTEWFTEGYITPSTELTREVFYELDGSDGSATETILGTPSDIIFSSSSDGSLGKSSLGKVSLGGGGLGTTLNKFRVIHGTVKNNFFEEFVEYRTNEVDQQWEILAFGSDTTISSDQPIKIKD